MKLLGVITEKLPVGPRPHQPPARVDSDLGRPSLAATRVLLRIHSGPVFHRRELTGMRLNEETPLPYAKDVKVPTMMTQAAGFLIHAERDGQAIFDTLGAQKKGPIVD